MIRRDGSFKRLLNPADGVNALKNARPPPAVISDVANIFMSAATAPAASPHWPQSAALADLILIKFSSEPLWFNLCRICAPLGATR